MLTIHKRVLTALAVALLAGGPARAEKPAGAASDKEFLTGVRAQARDLAGAVEGLQETIVEELKGQKERALYRRADAVLGQVADFEGALKGTPSRKQLYERFTALDQKLQQLVEAAEGLGADARALRRDVARVRAAGEGLFFALSAGDTTPESGRQRLKIEARRLLANAKALERTAQYALLKESGQISPGDFHKLVEAAARFEKSASVAAPREQLLKDLKALDLAWERAVQVLNKVKARDNLYLLRRAARVDTLAERLHRLLGVEGKRPGLTVNT